MASRGWNGDISTVVDILIIGTSNEQINLSGDSRAALFKGDLVVELSCRLGRRSLLD